MKRKIKLIITILVILLIICGVVIIFWLNKDSNDKSTNNKSNTGKKENADVETTAVYYCYRHKDEDTTYNDINYKYTKYYEFTAKSGVVEVGDNKLVYIYKFSSLADYQNFNINRFTVNQYGVIKDDENFTYTLTSSVTITPEGEKEKGKSYDLKTYLELLKKQGYSNCEKQK